MYEYTLYNTRTKEEIIKYGYNDNNVYVRNNLDINEWKIILKDYID